MAAAFTDSDILERLAVMLADPRMPVQQVVGKAANVPQGFVSMAANGRLKRVTARVRRLIEYSDNLLGSVDLRAQAEDTGKVPETADELHPAEIAAENELRDYLREGYDPTVVIAQLDVLRRAQQVRRPMRGGR
jgi:hypothetical protein